MVLPLCNLVLVLTEPSRDAQKVELNWPPPPPCVGAPHRATPGSGSS